MKPNLDILNKEQLIFIHNILCSKFWIQGKHRLSNNTISMYSNIYIRGKILSGFERSALKTLREQYLKMVKKYGRTAYVKVGVHENQIQGSTISSRANGTNKK